jgi:hypothetical protein
MPTHRRRAAAGALALAGGSVLLAELIYGVALVRGDWEPLGYLIAAMAIASAALLAASVRYAVSRESRLWPWVVGLAVAAIGLPAATALIGLAMS